VTSASSVALPTLLPRFEAQPQLATGDRGVDHVGDVVVHLYGRLLGLIHGEVNDEVGADHNGVHTR
jgi:hypothetical protein